VATISEFSEDEAHFFLPVGTRSTMLLDPPDIHLDLSSTSLSNLKRLLKRANFLNFDANFGFDRTSSDAIEATMMLRAIFPSLSKFILSLESFSMT
jgi:hypothetical protein